MFPLLNWIVLLANECRDLRKHKLLFLKNHLSLKLFRRKKYKQIYLKEMESNGGSLRCFEKISG